ncbi:MAG: FAD-dependent oxidoreductase [Deltaproteobacteria bacterium]|nr:FAD-dependent oxidoreductase [Deltaproteobacteria bacterium]
MEKLFEEFTIGSRRLVNRFFFPPIKLGYGNPDGTVTERQLVFYRQIAKNGPAVVILEPVSVTPEGREHPRQLRIDCSDSVGQLKKIVGAIHGENRLACLHLNHAGGAANPKVTGCKTKSASVFTCARSGQETESLTEAEIKAITAGYKQAAQKATEAAFDFIEVQAGHGYLVSQFLAGKINKREDAYGLDRLLLAKEVLAAVQAGAPDMPVIIRISGSEMSPEFGVVLEELLSLLKLSEKQGVAAVHVGMGHTCFSPPWYFHHGALPESPQNDALAWVRSHTSLPVIAAGRMGRKTRAASTIDKGLADLIALGRPLLADPLLIEKWKKDEEDDAFLCGYCLQGCQNRLASGESLGCNLNPEIGQRPLGRTDKPLKVLVAGGGPAGLSAALYLNRRGHEVTLAEKTDRLGGQFALAWQASGKQAMKDGLDGLIHVLHKSGLPVLINQEADGALVKKIRPDLVVWAVGAFQYVPEIDGLDKQYFMTAIDAFEKAKAIRGPRILVIGAGRSGLELAEKLGKDGYKVTATKRTDPIGGDMSAITRNLTMKRIDQMPQLTLMPHTTVIAFTEKTVEVERDGVRMSLEPFDTVILASGMASVPGPGKDIKDEVSHIEIIGDAREVQDIYAATEAGWQVALKY